MLKVTFHYWEALLTCITEIKAFTFRPIGKSISIFSLLKLNLNNNMMIDLSNIHKNPSKFLQFTVGF